MLKINGCLNQCAPNMPFFVLLRTILPALFLGGYSLSALSSDMRSNINTNRPQSIIVQAADINHTNQTLIKELISSPAIGKGRYKYYLWNIYDASLYSIDNKWSKQYPFALRLNYLRKIKADDIAEESAKQIRKQGYQDEIRLAAWYSQMRTIFPDVRKGDSLIGLFVPNQGAQFWHGSKYIGAINDLEFAHRFFNIWLGEKTIAPKLRSQLLGFK